MSDDRAITRRAALESTLRVGAFFCFVGHGAFGIITKEAWVPYFGVAGIGRDMAYQLMPLVGAMDILMGCLMLVRPRPIIAFWMAAWAVWTALLRPLSGEPAWETLERAGNYGVPAALAVMMVWPRGWRELIGYAHWRSLTPPVLESLRWLLAATVAALMIGHGALGAIHKAGLVTNYASIMSATTAEAITPYLGWFEIALGVAVLVRQAPALLVFICVWKIATETLFLTAGAPVWELIERGGSYASPIALMIVMRMRRAAGSFSREVDSSADVAAIGGQATTTS